MRKIFCLILILALATPEQLALAHDGQPPGPHDIWTAWNWEPFILLGLFIAGAAYWRGVSEAWQRAGRGRSITNWQAAFFSLGLLVIFVALVSPIDALSASLFSAHMIQHILLILVAAPLLVLGAPPAAIAWAVPHAWRRELSRWWHVQTRILWIWQAATYPVVIWFINALVLWIWHTPVLYQLALDQEWVHALQHASLLSSALLFWWIVDRYPTGRKLGLGPSILFIFTTALHSGLLGALITLGTESWYPAYANTTAAWNLTPLEDQQLAGVIMWVPAGAVYLGAVLLLLGSALHAMEQEDLGKKKIDWNAPPLRQASRQTGSSNREGSQSAGGLEIVGKE